MDDGARMMSEQNDARRYADGVGSAQPMEAALCETDITAMHAPVHEGSDAAVSPAISPAISPSTVENVQRTETDGDQSGNKSGSESAKKPNCYRCKHRRGLTYSCHSSCEHPLMSGKARVLALATGINPLGVTGSEHGLKNGWFFWPLDFDPVWLETCDGFDEIES